MANQYLTPGVYVEEIAKFPPSIAPVETAVPAFIGYTQTALDPSTGVDLTLTPTRVESLVEYERRFGHPQPEQKIKVTIRETSVSSVVTESNASAAVGITDRSKHIMYYALQLFYANGGGPCYVVSVGPYKPTFGQNLDKSELEKGLFALAAKDEPTLIVFPEAQMLSIADFSALHDLALAQCEDLKDRFVIMDVHGGAESMSDPNADLAAALTNFRTSGIGPDNLKYGAAYGPNIDTVLDMAYDETTTDVTTVTNGTPGSTVKMNTLQGSSTKTYEQVKAAIRDMACTMPPASAMAGIYARVDNTRGVWKAPANVGVIAAIQPSLLLTNKQQENMNVDPGMGKSVNAIRSFPGEGTIVWGGRTLAGNDNEWRYVNVKRFFIFVEESVKKATAKFVFEPNDANTWVKVQAMIENFLMVQWRQGALQGIKPEHAFYVAVGLGKTMTALDILEGRMIIEIGMAAVRPAEFIVLRFSHMMAQS